MIYKKPKGMKYTDMAIYVDSIICKDREYISEDEINRVFEYLYHIAFMLAHKYKYFKHKHDYEEFAIFFAGESLKRFILNPKLKQLDEEGNPKLSKIKSCLNYMKASINGRRIVYEQENYSQKFIKNFESLTPDDKYTYVNQVKDTMTPHTQVDLDIYVSQLGKTIKHFLNQNSFYANNTTMRKNIYISCLLSINKSLTLTQVDAENINNLYSSYEAKQNYLYNVYKNNRENSITLWHLDDELYDYIKVLVKELYDYICNDIKELLSTDIILDEELLAATAMSDIDGLEITYSEY